MAVKDGFEVIEVDGYDVMCDGGGLELGHPRVYLHIDASDGNVVCPYCSRTFLMKDAA